MLKDYYFSTFIGTKSTLKRSTIKAVEEILSSQACFPTYGRCRGYMKRVQSSGRIFLWCGFYFEVSEECRNNLLCLLKADFQSQEDNLRFKAFIDYTSHELSRDGVSVPKDLFNDEVKK